jgi:DNA polymerase-3 subunit gamma/tau
MDADSSEMLFAEPPQAQKAQPYRVLARKYRPQRFDELIGQDAMVQTLGNAIKRDRLAHAFLMTGVRGVGKTSTARLIAKALNCIGEDGQGGPTIDPCGRCEPCVAIAEGRHIDVVEMDAASHTGVDDVREIIEAVRYAAVSARYKVYIIDEVHMLSKNAFNALLKTLEEPPAHVKFLFATTEVNKVPVTVLSRCQRFDLRRISAEQLAAHFAAVCRLEGVEAEPEALALIARAAEGSARDAEGALGQVKEQYDLGVEPSALIRGLLESVHGITRAKVGGAQDPAQSLEEREAYSDWASRLGYATIHRIWQLLLKGLGEVNAAAMPLQAAEMALLRLIHASELPDPGALIEKLMNGEGVAAAAPQAPAAASQSALMKAPASFAALVEMFAANGKPHLAQQLHDFVGLVRYAPPALVIRPTKPLSNDLVRDMSATLKSLTGETWTVTASDADAEPTLLEQEKMAAERAKQAVLETPLVKAAFEAFPGAELINYTTAEQRSA